jgi:hypothetical protein
MTVSTPAIATQLGQEGLGQQPWWVEQWMELINSYRYKKRLERAWDYARSGNVVSIRFEGRRVHARVQGTGDDPYKVKLWLDVLNDEDWGYVLEALRPNHPRARGATAARPPEPGPGRARGRQRGSGVRRSGHWSCAHPGRRCP